MTLAQIERKMYEMREFVDMSECVPARERENRSVDIASAFIDHN